MSVSRKLLRVVVIGSVAGSTFLASVPAAFAGKSGGSTTTTCSRRNPCPAGDTTAPAAAILSPAAGSTASGIVTVTGSSSDNVGVVRVDLRIDGGPFQPVAGTTSWSSTIDTRPLSSGAHSFTVRALDAAGNAGTATISLTTSNSTPDTTAPVVAIASPAEGASVAGAFTVTGTASDNTAVSSVEVAVDGGAFALANGTTSWTATVDAASLSSGSHSISVRALDASGNAHVATRTVTTTTSASPGDVVVTDPAARGSLLPLGANAMATWGDVSGLVYTEAGTTRMGAWFRNAATGATSSVTLPTDSLVGWGDLGMQMTSATDLWVFGGSGPMVLRHYALSGSPLPSSATLVSSQTFGNSDSRPGDLLALSSGALVAAYHQQGANGLPQGQFVVYVSTSGAVSQLPALTYMPTRASDQVLAQQPVDGSVWLFANPDAWGAIGAARLTETNGSLAVSWTDDMVLSRTALGNLGPDPENPNLAAAADPATGTIAVAYQSGDRQTFTDGTTMLIGSRVAVARISATRSVQVILGAEYAERVSDVALAVAGGETLISYRPINASTMSFNEIHVARHAAGAWEAPITFGIAKGDPVVFGTGRLELSTSLSDGRLHFRSF